MQFKKDNPQQALDLDKDKQQRIKEQLKEMAATHPDSHNSYFVNL